MIRAYQRDDRSALLGIFRLNTPKFFHRDEESDFSSYLDRHAASFFVVEHQGQIVGCGGFHLVGEGAAGRISWTFLHPGHQGLGLGAELVHHCLLQLRSMPSVKRIIVLTSQYASAFFYKFGFRVEEIKKDYWAEGMDLHWMEMESNKLHNEELLCAVPGAFLTYQNPGKIGRPTNSR